ncbi:hypothetical protein PSHT_14912 [Puccinia striiformis]|uniref:Uncharacterized protein n=1 Tax=Puccinia striiformis TaxID=27350 RepID=A0A2S4UHZ1_9BASI|nr:hypothetical protein PSHT_14912 [Puccinia striiformis]
MLPISSSSQILERSLLSEKIPEAGRRPARCFRTHPPDHTALQNVVGENKPHLCMRCSQSLGAKLSKVSRRADSVRIGLIRGQCPSAGVLRRGLDPRGPLYKPSSKAKAQCFHTYRSW